ncbi:RNA 2'-phosphotransferase [Lachnoclostridium sp. An76]|uniref:RNA 2'-phosphotransferase n=1 Tax=Lachnoclostridium sp. An76 TaxID=1965654 RepID=UPI001FA89726|nr:RNA 2'-phosphotransferase [Lachnoclostridium sp. An76]
MKRNKVLENMSYDRLSRYLSLILRHHPEVLGISLDAHGWADVDELIAGIAQKKNFNREILEEIVRTDKKQRYSFSEDGAKIRANQGHSVQVDLELQPIEPPDLLWHGTAEKYTASIEKTGLKSGSRMYVHLSPDIETAVAVGKRHGRPIVYEVKSGQMYRDGFCFYRSANGVWLTHDVTKVYLVRMESSVFTRSITI